ELESYILTFNNSESDAVDFFSLGVKKNIGKVIQVKNYVGLIQMKNGYQIQILPKITNINELETKKLFLKMLRCLKDFPSKIFTSANLHSDKMNLYEIFINMYLQQVRELVKRGIKSSYILQKDNLYYYKGKLIISKHINYNHSHKERFYLQYDEFNVNRPENKLIKSTLIKLMLISQNTSNIKAINQLLSCFDSVDASKNYSYDFSRIIIDRNMKEYVLLMKWSKVFLFDQSFTTFSGDNIARSLLFPMEKVFEAYVAKHLKKIFSEKGYDVIIQDKKYYLFDEPKQFALIPDIVIENGRGQSIIVDTKWKSLKVKPNKNYGISQSDIYQMYAYAKKYDSREIWLLYPFSQETKDLGDMEFISYKDGEIEVIINVFFVDVANINESITTLSEKMFYLI
ncbi:MAG: McrC family protein, partial [Bacilli bacterium]